jgi:hypothetical protein
MRRRRNGGGGGEQGLQIETRALVWGQRRGLGMGVVMGPRLWVWVSSGGS